MHDVVCAWGCSGPSWGQGSSAVWLWVGRPRACGCKGIRVLAGVPDMVGLGLFFSYFTPCPSVPPPHAQAVS